MTAAPHSTLLAIHGQIKLSLTGTSRHLFGQNILLPTSPDSSAFTYGALLFLVEGGRAVALVVRLSFNSPVVPILRPGHPIWEQHVSPAFDRALGLLRFSHHQLPLLESAVKQAQDWARQHSAHLIAGGCEVLSSLPAKASLISSFPSRPSCAVMMA